MRIPDLQRFRHISISTTGYIVIYVVALCISEIVAATISPVLGVLGHGIILVLLIFQAASGKDHAEQRAFQALILIPLMRILSVTLPIQELNPLYWNFVVGLPVLLAVILMIRSLKFSARDIGLRPIRWKYDVLIAISGIILSPIAYYLSPPTYLPDTLKNYEVVLVTIIVIVFVGFMEELIFRGILQRTMQDIAGQSGLMLVNILFAMMYFGSFSMSYIIFMGVVGQFFTRCRQQGSLWGVVLAHSFMILGILIQDHYI